MRYFTEEQQQALTDLGKRLKSARLNRNDPQKEFAYRIGVSIPTLYKMEQGSPNVSIGAWIKSLDMLDRLNELSQLFAPEESLAARYDAYMITANRQRARRKK